MNLSPWSARLAPCLCPHLVSLQEQGSWPSPQMLLPWDKSWAETIPNRPPEETALVCCEASEACRVLEPPVSVGSEIS